MFGKDMQIAGYDDELWSAMQAEAQRQEDHIELIASENYTSPRVLQAQGSVLTNKYAEGYPGKRYYGGCEYVDVAESLAIARAKQLFGADTYRSSDGGLYGVRSGTLSRTQGGSLILDELLALPLDVQRHLNDKLSEQRLGREGQGGAKDGVTLIALTDGDAPAAVAEGRLRHDLWYRLQRLVLHVPPLRERPEDITHTALWVANRVLRSRGLGRPAELLEASDRPAPLSSDSYCVHASAVAVLRKHSWPGNFRELEAVMERAILLYSNGNELCEADVRAAIADGWVQRAGQAPRPL